MFILFVLTVQQYVYIIGTDSTAVCLYYWYGQYSSMFILLVLTVQKYISIIGTDSTAVCLYYWY